MSMLAVPVEGDQVSDHFGHSKSFAFVYLENGNLVKKEVHATPPMQNRHDEFPKWFLSKQVDSVIVVRIGGGVYRTLKSRESKYTKRLPQLSKKLFGPSQRKS
ncbi:NifB/NifX family molybdenum-iron cluster-binding protein [Heliorestis convoluta]|uniref:Dinitrogenase iron-molybdenum cofactor family protein, putative n=1 Tax=Heliorestis convoluta TaxID=356322 RepID=A0A5Q2N7L3_9FIRM|nr:NifB/NifX family molybdenum-iron cluster-binding protein [Heliorestis convoluta]QGG48475.1 dinitrogenase iron-molybdenum cofactor family protein, putative [Heliorestis convoluta]